jgi:hypothetical protein
MDADKIYSFNITNGCTCQDYDIESAETIQSEYCYGDCWNNVIQDFTHITEHLFDKNETMWWKVNNLRLWDGEHSGYIYARSAEELIRGMSVNSEWSMHGGIYSEYIKYSLHHHDAPMGSNSIVTIISEDQREAYGLY